MVELKVQLNESVVQAIGHKQVESILQEFVKKMLLQAADPQERKQIEIEQEA